VKGGEGTCSPSHLGKKKGRETGLKRIGPSVVTVSKFHSSGAKTRKEEGGLL